MNKFEFGCFPPFYYSARRMESHWGQSNFCNLYIIILFHCHRPGRIWNRLSGNWAIFVAIEMSWFAVILGMWYRRCHSWKIAFACSHRLQLWRSAINAVWPVNVGLLLFIHRKWAEPQYEWLWIPQYTVVSQRNFPQKFQLVYFNYANHNYLLVAFFGKPRALDCSHRH